MNTLIGFEILFLLSCVNNFSFDKKKKVLTSAIGRKVGGLPLCWKAFSENPTPHQQHWAASRCHQATTLYAIGRCHPSALMFKTSFSPENRESIVAWVNKL